MAQVHNRQDIILEALNEEQQQQNKQTNTKLKPSLFLIASIKQFTLRYICNLKPYSTLII